MKNSETKKKGYPHKIPRDYLKAIADKLHRMNPSMPIVENTITDVWISGHNIGYERKQGELLKFKNTRKKTINDEWNEFKDLTEDIIHSKNLKT